ncbi:DUF4190 domain-containing protein [Streptomyces sp. CB01201]|uniref:DUF4190 domain-containing protein n=1 Tax=Streptomyces sp. CB01201 TaxID=2020324 RepID=UPI00131D2A0D|nr:DUF4190 domain-containing protein [Streptomyces sp. CB01201]
MVDVVEEVRIQPENRAAGISMGAAMVAVVVASGSMWASAASFYMPATAGWFVLVELSAWTAIISGHVARRRARRHRLPGRWWALASILAGWVCSLYAGLVMLVAVGVFAGFALLFEALR